MWTMLPVRAAGGAGGQWSVTGIVDTAVMCVGGIMLDSCIIGGGDGAIRVSGHMLGAGGSGGGMYH
jgi:hypothetical protein